MFKTTWLQPIWLIFKGFDLLVQIMTDFKNFWGCWRVHKTSAYEKLTFSPIIIFNEKLTKYWFIPEAFDILDNKPENKQ